VNASAWRIKFFPSTPSPSPFRSPILCCYLRVIPSPAIIPTLRLAAHEHLFRRIQRSLVSQANTSRHCQHFHLFNNSLLDLRQLFHYLPLCASMRSNIVIGSFHYSLSLSSALLVGPGPFVHSQTRLRWWGWNDLGNRRHPHETLPLPLLVLPVESWSVLAF
jgi:hypothetical protein